MHQPDDEGPQQVIKIAGGNGVHKLVLGVASALSLMLLTIGGVALAKLYDLGERVARVETMVQMMVERK